MGPTSDMPTVERDKAACYQPLIARVRARIDEGRIKPGAMIGSEHALARETGLSRYSVRRAIETLICDGLVERRPGKGVFVRDHDSLNRTVQLVVGNIQWETMMHLYHGAQEAGRERGILLNLYDAHGDFELDLDTLRNLPETQTDGAIIGSLHNRRFAEVLYELKTRGYPFVLVDEVPEYLDIPAIGCDNYAAGLRIGRELVERGHRKISFIGDLVAPTTRDRLAGVRDAVNDAGIAFDRSRVVDLKEDDDRLGRWAEQVRACTRQVMAVDFADRPTAVVFSCDAVAAFAYPVFRQVGLAIGEDVSVVGFDDASMCHVLDPPLATMRQPMRDMGRQAIEMLLQRLASPNDPPEQRVLEATWVPRESIGTAPTVRDS